MATTVNLEDYHVACEERAARWKQEGRCPGCGGLEACWCLASVPRAVVEEVALYPNGGIRLPRLCAGWKSVRVGAEDGVLVIRPGGPLRLRVVRGSTVYLALGRSRAVWRSRLDAQASVEIDGGPVAVRIPLPEDVAARFEERLNPPAAVVGRVEVRGSWLVIPAALRDALVWGKSGMRFRARVRGGKLVVYGHPSGRQLDELRGETLLLLPVTLQSGEYDAAVLRDRRGGHPRLVVRLSSPAPSERLVREVRRGVFRVCGDEDVASALAIRAAEEGVEEKAWTAEYMRRWAEWHALAALQDCPDEVSLEAVVERGGGDRSPLISYVGDTSWSAVEIQDLLERELLPPELRLVRLLAQGYSLEEAGEQLEIDDSRRVLRLVRAIVARALDEAGCPPLRPSQRWRAERWRMTADPDPLPELNGTGQLALFASS